MKKFLLFSIILLVYCLSVSAQDPVVKFYLNDGNSKKFNIEDITTIEPIKSNSLYLMEIYLHNKQVSYLVANIKSIEFIDLQKIQINRSSGADYINLRDIDSIIFTSNLCYETSIGTQIWSCKNLDVDHYRNGDPIPNVTDQKEWDTLTTGAWCYYENDPNNGAIFGKLYNWYAVNDHRGLAPAGWHIPNEKEWDALTNDLGGEYLAGGKLKEEGTDHWDTLNLGSTNEVGFTALPSGYRSYHYSFSGKGTYTGWWSASDTNYYSSPIRQILSSEIYLEKNVLVKISGYSVRCLKSPSSETQIINSISPNPISIGDIVTITGKNFGFTQDLSYVSFNNVKPAEKDYRSWTDSLIKVVVPTGARTGKISVTLYGFRSNQVDITINCDADFGKVKDIDGTEYKTIRIGKQWWMAENLKVKHYRNGDIIPEVRNSIEWFNLKTGAWCNYQNDASIDKTYGKLYNWYTVSDLRGLAPKGWRVPTTEDWMELETYLGGSYIAGGNMKTTGNYESNTGLWLKPNKGATNISEFTALPCGYRLSDKGGYNGFSQFTMWWTSDDSFQSSVEAMKLSYDESSSFIDFKSITYGLSIRCIKNAAFDEPAIDSITPDSAAVGDVITLYGENFGETQDSSFIAVNNIKLLQSDYVSWSDKQIKIKVPVGVKTGMVSITVKGHKSYEAEFKLIYRNEFSTVTDVDGNVYKTVKINNQWWMAENLKVTHYRDQTPITEISDSAEWIKQTSGAWCNYNNDQSNGLVYGKLYNSYAINNPSEIAPKGWHIASDAEWKTLEMYLGLSPEQIDATSWRGTNESYKIREKGTKHWIESNEGITNEIGFSALPGGIRRSDGEFSEIGAYTGWWTSTDKDSSNTFIRAISTGYLGIFRSYLKKNTGYSVRCVKD